MLDGEHRNALAIEATLARSIVYIWMISVLRWWSVMLCAFESGAGFNENYIIPVVSEQVGFD